MSTLSEEYNQYKENIDGKPSPAKTPSVASEYEAYKKTVLQNPEPAMSLSNKISKASEYLPTAGAFIGGGLSMAAAPGTAGASLLGGSALAGLGAAAGKAGEQLVKRMVGEEAPKTSGEAAGKIFKEGAFTAAINAIGGKIIEAAAPAFKLASKQILKGFAHIDERLSMKVLNDPSILSRAKPLNEAASDFAKFWENNGFKYGRESLKMATGKRKLSDDAVDDLVSSTLDDIEALATKKSSKRDAVVIQKALAARYSTKDAIKRAIRSGEDENARFFINARNQVDDWLEGKIPGFSDVRKTYEEAKIKQAFSPLFPLNKNKETSILGLISSIGSTLASGKFLGPVAAVPIAVASSPLLAGQAIKVGAKLTTPPAIAAGSELIAGKIAKGIKVEQKDHPQLSKEQAKLIALQELDKNPNAYEQKE